MRLPMQTQNKGIEPLTAAQDVPAGSIVAPVNIYCTANATDANAAGTEQESTAGRDAQQSSGESGAGSAVQQVPARV